MTRSNTSRTDAYSFTSMVAGVPRGYDLSQILSTLSSWDAVLFSFHASRGRRGAGTRRVLERAATEGREAGAEDCARIDQIRIGDDAVGERDLRFGDVRANQP